MSDVTEAAKIIRWAACQPEIEESAWGGRGKSDVSLYSPPTTRTVSRNGKAKTVRRGGYKEWRYDLARAGEHLWGLVTGKGDGIFSELSGGSRKHHWRMFKHYLRANNLERPDGVVGGTTLYGVWIEEVWHASLWSPTVAKAVANLLEENPDSENAQYVAALLKAQHRALLKDEEDEDED